MLCYHHYSQSCCLLFYTEILKYDKQLDMHKAILYHVVSTLFHVATYDLNRTEQAAEFKRSFKQLS